MTDKWNLLRPDKPLSQSALSTQGNRVHTRAINDAPGKQWLSAKELEVVTSEVEEEFEAEYHISQDNSDCSQDQESGLNNEEEYVNVSGLPSENEENTCQRPCSEKPKCQEYQTLLTRAARIYNDIKTESIQDQHRRKPKKKSYSMRNRDWMNWMAFEMLESLSEPKRNELSCINMVIYSI